jgi:DNA invertase Pin-like site-specific DNA recombinase
MPKSIPTEVASCIPAAQYVRMSTENQEYSIDNQKAGIRDYAEQHNFNIVETYEDAGKSGLVLNHREGLRSLLQDVLNGDVTYKAILVYDVSRWGRFQDVDESAYYEFICKHSGVPVHYCAEQFSNDETLHSTLIKALKRSMAAEFSRELGIKVYNGKRRLVQLGFWVGGEAGYGYRRLMISASGKPKLKLKLGEHKSCTTDRVVLVPGDKIEIETVRHMFKMAARNRLGPTEIARRMNNEGKLFQGRLWNNVQVSNVLRNPKYAGWNVWGRHTQKLGSRLRTTRPEEWTTKEGAFPALIDQTTFEQVQKKLMHQTDREWSDEELKARLRRLLASKGRLSEGLILKTRGMCSPTTLKLRFGSSYRNVFDTIGYQLPLTDLFRGERQEPGLRLRRELVEKIQTMFPENVEITHQRMRSRSILLVDNKFYVGVLLCRKLMATRGHPTQWIICPNSSEYGYITLLCRLNADDAGIFSYHVFPSVGLEYHRSREGDPWLKTGIHLKSLNEFYDVVRTISLQQRNDAGARSELVPMGRQAADIQADRLLVDRGGEQSRTRVSRLLGRFGGV